MRVWEIVQDVREHKRWPPKYMEAPNLFSGLVYCADYGRYMVLCRTEKMWKAGLKTIVLDDLRREIIRL